MRRNGPPMVQEMALYTHKHKELRNVELLSPSSSKECSLAPERILNPLSVIFTSGGRERKGSICFFFALKGMSGMTSGADG